MSLSLSYSLHIIVTGSTAALLYCDLLPTPSSIMHTEEDLDKSPTITVNVKATAEFTYTIKTVKVKVNNWKNVKELVNEALEIKENYRDEYYKCVQVTTKTTPVEDFDRKLSTFPGGTVLDISWKKNPTDAEKIQIMKHYTKPPSDYGKENESRNLHLSFMKAPICDHREGRVGDDVTLYYPGFQQFVDKCNNDKFKPSKRDFHFAKTVCAEMSNYFPKEKDRENTFAQTITQFLNTYGQKVEVLQSKPGKSVADIVIGPNSCIIIEIKNESGQGGGSDSHSQAIGYYVQTLEKRNPGQCPAPAYLIELVGPQLTISGAVYGRYVFVDKLIDPVWLVPQHNEEAIFKIARIFRALGEAIGEIQQYYARGSTVIPPRFPVYQPFKECPIQYVKAIKPHTYEGTLMQYGNVEQVHVIIKFVKRYSHEAHQFMHIKGYAPELIFHAEGVNDTRYKAIVTKKIDFSHYGYNVRKEVIHDKFIEAVTTLYKGGFCHGNLLPKHIGYAEGTGRIYILNYEWATKQNDTKYPLLEHPTSEEEMELLKKLFQ